MFGFDGGKSNDLGEVAKPPFTPETSSVIRFISCVSELYPELWNMLLCEGSNLVTLSGLALDAQDDTQWFQAVQKIVADANVPHQTGSGSGSDGTDPTNPAAIATGFTNLFQAKGIRVDFQWAIEQDNTVFQVALIQGHAHFILDGGGTRRANWLWGAVHSASGLGVSSTTEVKVGTDTGNKANLSLTNFGGQAGLLIFGSITGFVEIFNTSVTVSFNTVGIQSPLGGSKLAMTVTTY